jgi:hypothetical protein
VKYTPKTTFFPHQKKAVIQAVKARNYGIFMEPRLGKTKTALDWAAILALKGEVRRVVVLAPKIALSVWEEEIPKHFPYPCTVENYEESWQHIDKIYPGSPPEVAFFLAGREASMRAERINHRLVRTKQRELEDFDPDAVIIDESHEYKRPGARGAQDAWRMVTRLRKRNGNGRPYVLLLSGTPNPKGWRDLFAQFRIMDDSIFGTNAGDFDEKHVIYGHGSRRYTVMGYKKEKTIVRKVRAHSISVSADETGLNGKQFWHAIKVSLPPRARKLYTDVATEMIGEWDDGQWVDAKNAGVRRLRLLQIAGGFLTDGTNVHSEKLLAARGYYDLLLEQDESVISYCRFSPEVEALSEISEKAGYRTYLIAGPTDAVDRVRYIRELQSRRAPVSLVFQIQTGRQSIELSAAAEVLYYSTPDGWVDYWQSLNRVRGPNQDRPVRYTHLISRGTVDLAAWDGLRKKEDWHQTLMRNPKRYLRPL